MAATSTPPDQPLAHSPDDAARRLGVATRSIYTAIARGDIKSFKLGKRRLIAESELVALVERKQAEAA